MKTSLLKDIENYYTDKISRFGPTSRGVDWNSSDSQELRFRQICRIFIGDTGASVCDIGCGYGALADYLSRESIKIKYTGIDISKKMIEEAISQHKNNSDIKFFVASRPTGTHDYCVASGIFNVRNTFSDPEWKAHIMDTLQMMADSSTKGFSFNCLTSFSDPEFMKDYLYYADPCELFKECKIKHSKNIALLHDYGLYEFTILVKKS